MTDHDQRADTSDTASTRHPIKPARLVLCLDGTWNRADDAEITNIVHLRDLVEPKVETSTGDEYQRVYYHTGVGTGISKATNVFDGATGRGLGPHVRGIYKFLCQNLDADLEIYIFGFSRGAFTARSLIGYIAASGLLKAEHCSPENEERAWQYYRCAPDRRYPSQNEALRKLCHDQVNIRALGVFDTVGALGVPVEWFRSWNRKRFQFHDVALSTIVDYAFHAVAIDELRGPFEDSLWQYPNHQYFKRAEQVWFPGAHANIGGGYENNGLSGRTLFWMLSRIQKHTALKFIKGWEDRVKRLITLTDPVVDSRTALYSWSKIRPMIRCINQCEPHLGRLPRISALPPHAIPLGEMLDRSALWRWKHTDKYRPPNLRAVLDRTFTCDDPRPIPIVGENGDALDWIRNESDRKALEAYIPDEYKTSFADTIKYFAQQPDVDTSAYSTPYQKPRSSNW